MNSNDDAILANESRIKKVALEVAREDRAAMWDRLGFDIRTEEGLNRLARSLWAMDKMGIDLSTPEGVREARGAHEWAVKAHIRAENFGKRLLFWVSTTIGLTAGVFQLFKTWFEWRAR